MGTRRLDSLTDLSRQGCNLRIACSCGHVRVMTPFELITAKLGKRGGLRIEQLERQLRCGECGRRDSICTPVEDPDAPRKHWRDHWKG